MFSIREIIFLLIATACVSKGLYLESSYSLCPNFCSGHGICLSNDATILCSCFGGYHGGDCSYRVCPAGAAWFDFPSEDNIAHALYTECSNMGTCDHATGSCTCRDGFGGAACEQLLCPVGVAASGNTSVCSGNGRCMSLRDSAAYRDHELALGQVTYTEWDADMVHGCVCDDGWEGSSCSRRSCPKGDDPYTTDQNQEIQVLECTCDGSCDGTFRLSFHGENTAKIPLNASAEVLKYRLEQLDGLDLVTVNISKASSICNGHGVATAVTFLIPQGNVSALGFSINSDATDTVIMKVIAGNHDYSTIDPTYMAQDGASEYVECSGRGVCDYSLGTCDCFDNFMSSDGLGGPGSRGDCGYFYWDLDNYPTDLFCPYAINLDTNITELCSGHGSCSAGSCVCDTAYGGPGCSEKLCSSVSAWFGSVGQSHGGSIECAGVGDCNRRTGTCSNCGGNWGTFYGEYCEYLSCASDASGNTCSGNGVCLSLREIALLTYNDNKNVASLVYESPWDADMVRGCACFREVAVDNQYSDALRPGGHRWRTQYPDTYNVSKLYRGPYSHSATSWTGYNCDTAFCPSGIDPQSRNAYEGELEIQQIHCRGATNGTFRLSFRGNISQPIPFDANAASLKGFIEEIYTITTVSVTLNDDALCNANKEAAYVTFLTEFGDLPLMSLSAVSLQVLPAESPEAPMHIIRVTEEQKGSFDEYECSRQGICDRETGRCKCFTGFSSSGGLIGTRGERGDCTYVDKYYMTHDT